MLTLLRKKVKEYTNRNADNEKPPAGTLCSDCKLPEFVPEPGSDEPAVTLALCSVCQRWRCSTCYSQHRAPESWYEQSARPAWWKRVLR
jgi:hypothetical protein